MSIPYLHSLRLVCPQMGTWPTTQACALTGNQTRNLFVSQAGPQSSEPHQPGHYPLILINVALGLDLQGS